MQELRYRASQRRLKAVNHLNGTAGSTEATDRLIAGQGQYHFRLVIAVLVIAVRGINGNPSRILIIKANACPLNIGVHLQRQWLIGSNHLKQVRKLIAKARHNISPHHPHRVASYQLVQGGRRGG